MEKSEVVPKVSYRTFKSRFGTVLIEADVGDFKSITLYKRVIVNKPGLIITTGGIPDALKTKDGAWFSFTHPARKDHESPTAMFLQDNELMRRSMKEEKLGMDRVDGQQQQEHDEKGGEHVEDHPTTLTVSVNLHVIINEGLPPSLLSVSKEDWIPAKPVWFTFVSRGGYRYLGRHVGRFLLVSQYEGIIVNKPGAVAAVGGIPDELKIEGGISFSYPAPIYKFPRIPRTKLSKFDREVRVEDMGKELCCKALMQAYSEAVGISSICKYDEFDEDEEDHMDELFPTSIVVNLATPQDIEQLNPSIWPIVTQSIPIKDVMEEQYVGAKRPSEDVKEASPQAAHKRSRLSSSSICKQVEDEDKEHNPNQQPPI